MKQTQALYYSLEAFTLRITLSFVHVCAYLCAGVSWRRGVVVRPRYRQVVTAALAPQTLDVERRFATWLVTRRQRRLRWRCH